MLGGGLMEKLKSKFLEYFFKIQKAYYRFDRVLKTHILVKRLFSVLTCLVFFILFAIVGYNHMKKEEYIKAMTISDIKEELTFSKTGANLKLYPQKRNKDMTVIPFMLKDTSVQSTNAKDYKTIMLPIMRKQLPSNIKTSIVFFDDSGKGAIVVKGDLPKEPISIILANFSNFDTDNSGDSKLYIAGKETIVDYNGVGITLNAKANNVKTDKTITPDMSLAKLYYTSFGERDVKSWEKTAKKSVKYEEKLHKRKDNLILNIKKANKALGKDENDMSYDNYNDLDSDSDSTSEFDTTSTDEETDGSSDTNVKSKRENTLNDLENVKGQIQEEQDTQQAMQIKAANLEQYITQDIFDLFSIESDSEVRENDRI